MKRCLLAAVVFLLFAVESQAQKISVTFNAPDGSTLKGDFYSKGRPGPGILFLHECNADHHLYDELGGMLSTAGYNVLAFDHRAGSQMPGDIDAAMKFLTSQDTVNSNALGIVGSECGANQAVHAAQRHDTVRTVVLISGGTDAEGELFIKNSPKLPILGIASEEDKESAAMAKKAVEDSSNAYSHVQMFKNAGHAASIFSKEPDLEADIVIWFRTYLAIGGYGLPPTIK